MLSPRLRDACSSSAISLGKSRRGNSLLRRCPGGFGGRPIHMLVVYTERLVVKPGVLFVVCSTRIVTSRVHLGCGRSLGCGPNVVLEVLQNPGPREPKVFVQTVRPEVVCMRVNPTRFDPESDRDFRDCQYFVDFPFRFHIWPSAMFKMTKWRKRGLSRRPPLALPFFRKELPSVVRFVSVGSSVATLLRSQSCEVRITQKGENSVEKGSFRRKLL